MWPAGKDGKGTVERNRGDRAREGAGRAAPPSHFPAACRWESYWPWEPSGKPPVPPNPFWPSSPRHMPTAGSVGFTILQVRPEIHILLPPSFLVSCPILARYFFVPLRAPGRLLLRDLGRKTERAQTRTKRTKRSGETQRKINCTAKKRLLGLLFFFFQ